MPWIAAAIGAVGAIGGGLISSNAADKAADTSAAASRAAIDETRRQFDIGQGNLRPWLQTGSSALGKLAKLYGLDSYTLPPPTVGTPAAADPFSAAGQAQPAVPTGTYVPAGAPGDMSDFFASPDYQYRLTQAMKTLEARAATGAFGGLDSGALRKAELQRSGDLASGEFGTYVNRLSAIGGVGQTAANETNALGANASTSIANRLQNAGDTQASAYGNQGKTWADALGKIGGYAANAVQNRGGGSVPYGTPGSWSDYGYAF